MNFRNGGSKYFRTNFSYISAKFGVSITKSQETIDFSDFLEIALKIENLHINFPYTNILQFCKNCLICLENILRSKPKNGPKIMRPLSF